MVAMNDKQKMIVPWSKGNEVEQKPIEQNIFLTMDNLPIQMAVAAMAQVEPQGWTVRFLVFAGMGKTSGLAIAQAPSIPLYNVILCKMFIEGTEIVNPVLDFGQNNSAVR